jgi:hypothetical protein
MPYRVVEELKTSNPDIIIDGLEQAKEVLVLNGMTLEESIEFLDSNGWSVWHDNRDSILDTITNVVFEWDQEEQILSRTFVFESEVLYEEYRYMINQIFPPHERKMILKEVTSL